MEGTPSESFVHTLLTESWDIQEIHSLTLPPLYLELHGFYKTSASETSVLLNPGLEVTPEAWGDWHSWSPHLGEGNQALSLILAL